MTRSSQIALAILGITLLWLATGLFKSSKKEGATHDQQKLVRVRYVTSVAQDRFREKVVRGHTKASRSVDVRAKISGTIQGLLVEKGAKVSEGQPILKISLEDRVERLNEAKAQRMKREAEYKAYQALHAKKFASDTELATKKAELELAQAALQKATLDMEYTEVKAPFSGILDQRLVEVGDLVSPGQAILRVIDIETIKVEVPVTEDLMVLLRMGQGADVMVQGKTFQGKVIFIGAEADVSTRMFPVELVFANPSGSVPSGATAEVHLSFEKSPAHLITPAILALKEDGQMGVKVIDAENKAVFYPIEILSQTDAGMWVKGLPETCRIMTVGQDFVQVGQKVDPVEDGLTTEPKEAQE